MNIKRYIRIATTVLGISILAGCSSIGTTALHVAGLQSINDGNAKIAAVQASDRAAIDSLNRQIETQKATIEAANLAKTQEASNHVFLAEMTFNLDPAPTGFGLLMHTEDTAAALTLPPPDANTVATGIDKMRAILADKDKQVAAMAAEVAAAKNKADTLTATVATAQSQISTIKDQIEVVKQNDAVQVAAIQKAKDLATTDALNKQAALLDDKKANDALKKKLCIGAASIAAIAFLAAIFLPLLKRQCVETGMLFGGLAVAVPYVEGWMVAASLGVGLLYVAISTFLEHKSVVTQTVAAIPSNTSSAVISTAIAATPPVTTTVATPAATAAPTVSHT